MIKDWLKYIFAAAFAATLVLGIAIATPAGAGKPASCKADGKACVCNTGNGCGYNCAEAGCKFEQHGAGAATFTCKKGKCTAVSDGVGATQLYCPGGGCTLTCTGAGACNLYQCKQDCKVECTGAGTCKNDEQK